MTPRLQWLTWPALLAPGALAAGFCAVSRPERPRLVVLLAVDQWRSDSLEGAQAHHDSGLRWLLENDADCEPDLWARGLSATNSIGHLCRAFTREAVAPVALCSG